LCGVLTAVALVAGCGEAGPSGSGGEVTEAGVDEGAVDEAAVERPDVEPRGELATGGCDDPDRPGQEITRACASPCGAGTQRCVNNYWTTCSARQPAAEQCENGLDDDCDGQVDEDCGMCAPGASRPCTSRPPVGACRAGMETCTAARAWGACEGEVGPAAEVCDGVDNDCNGAVDDGLMRACAGRCGAGMQACVGGQWSACAGREPTPEACNGVDDDCDGAVDNVTRPCSSGCGAGTQRCLGGAWGACDARPPGAEVCNGVDDDCDGAVDEGLTRACSSACGAGSETCAGGAWRGCSARQPSPEVCDLADNNCDGRVDEGLRATFTFTNRCRRSNVFFAIGCNPCRTTCTGYWMAPGASQPVQFEQNTCYNVSAFARTPGGDICFTIDRDTGSVIGEVRRTCNGDCRPDTYDYYCNGSD